MANRDIPSLSDRAIAAAVRLVMGCNRRLSWQSQNRLTGWLGRCLVSLAPPLRKRINDNLKLVYPDLSGADRRRIRREVATNFGQTFFENFHSERFLERARSLGPLGPGYEAICEARKSGRPVIIVSGHFGNWDVVRALLKVNDLESGAVYRPQNNRAFNEIFKTHVEAIGRPLFGKGRQGTRDMVKHLKDGGIVSILIDQKIARSPVLDFLGHPAETSTAAADLALKFDALLVPVYGTRQPDGITLKAEFEAPVPHSDALSMTQFLNNSLAARVRQHPGQWFWFHKRWKLSASAIESLDEEDG